MSKKPSLHVVGTGSSPGADPPRPLGIAGRALWDAVQREYDVGDVGGCEMLAQACAALDRAEGLAAAIEADGAIIRTRGGVRAHPGIRDELACRAFVTRTIARLGLNFETIKSIGRPGGRACGVTMA